MCSLAPLFLCISAYSYWSGAAGLMSSAGDPHMPLSSLIYIVVWTGGFHLVHSSFFISCRMRRSTLLRKSEKQRFGSRISWKTAFSVFHKKMKGLEFVYSSPLFYHLPSFPSPAYYCLPCKESWTGIGDCH